MNECSLCGNVFASVKLACPSCGHQPVILNGIKAYAPNLANGGGGFKPEFFSELAVLEANNFWFRARGELILWVLQTYGTSVKNLLEVGCGTGFVLLEIANKFPEIALTGSEIFIEGIAHATERLPNTQFIQMDARHVPFVDEFDAIGMFDVLEHIHEDEAVLCQLNKALKLGGLLLLTVPQHSWLWSAADENACHVRRYQSAELSGKLATAGFKVLRNTSFVSLLLPAMILSRLRTPAGNEYDITSELRLPKVLNSLFLAIMRFENRMIKMGVNFPLGGSRMIVAEKVH